MYHLINEISIARIRPGHQLQVLIETKLATYPAVNIDPKTFDAKCITQKSRADQEYALDLQS